MIIDGRALAGTIIASLQTAIVKRPIPPRLVVFACAPNFETQKFLTLKTKRAHEAGVAIEVVMLPEAVTVHEVTGAIAQVLPHTDAIIIQFPFPHLATGDLIPLVPVTHDVDVMGYAGGLPDLLPPVVGAIAEMSRVHQIEWAGKQVAIVGNGRLVGAPMVAYATARGAAVTLITKESPNTEALQLADIVVLGAGVPGLLRADMVKEGVVVFDAGTSEEGGVLVGDADPAVADKASFFTPVPGGIGPLTVAVLLKNVLYLAESRSRQSDSVV